MADRDREDAVGAVGSAVLAVPLGRGRHWAAGSQRLSWRLPVLSILVGATVLLAAVPAQALISRGHVFASSFEGSGKNSFKDPTGVAVDEASGEVYVVDRSAPHERVERFKPDGAGGYVFASAFDVKSPEDIAVDNSTNLSDPSRGDVYVVGAEEEGAAPEEHNVLYKYDPGTGKVVSRKSSFHSGSEVLALEVISGVAVDASGGLWVYWGEEGTISGFSDQTVNKWLPAATKELHIRERFECRARPGFAVAAGDEYFYVAHERETALQECPEEEGAPALVAKFTGAGELVTAGLDHKGTTGVAVDPVRGEAYVDNGGSVAAFASNGSLIQNFGSGSLSTAGALAVDSAEGLVFAAEPGEGKISVFASEAAGPPMVDSTYSQNLSPSSERLIAEIDPKGADTTYYFQYGTSSCVSQPAACTDVPTPPGTDIGSGFGDQVASAEVTGLSANTTYYYRVLAHNANGTAESSQATETFFTTLPAPEGVLLDGRQWELVSPPEKHGASIEPISKEGALIQASADGNEIAWAASAPVAGEPGGNRRPEPVQVISARDPARGWSSQDIATPHDSGEGYDPGAETEYRFFSPDLSTALVEPQIPAQPFEDPPLAPEATEKTMYLRDSANGEYTPLVTTADVASHEKFGGKLEFAGASADLKHVLFGSEVPLTTGAAGAGLYEWASGTPLDLVSVLPGIAPVPASEPWLGDHGRNVRNAISSDGSRVFWTNGGGDEGPLFVRDAAKGETIQVNAAQGVVEPGEEEIAEGLDTVHFQGASSDGSRVLFTDAWPLTTTSTLEPLSKEESIEEPPEGARALGRPADLYEFDVTTGVLKDLTPDNHAGETADVLGTLPGISEDGSYVYFVANGVLAPGAQPGDCPRTKPLLPQPEDSCNLYLSEPDQEHPGQRRTILIARLSAEDAGDWGGGHSPPGSLGGVSSQVSSDGRYLAFMSERELTGYHNVDASPQAKGAHDQEVFLYDAAAGRLVCASCNPGGGAPHGVFDTEEAGEGLGLLVDRPETWNGHWLAASVPGWTLIGLNNPVAEHQSRYLTSSGRLFFNSPDALVEQAKSGKENVYEYEPEGVGSCRRPGGCVALISSGISTRESAFLDASATGNDVFFLTAARLVPQDTDENFDIYDARVCGTPETQPCLQLPPPPPPPCKGEGCRPPGSPPPSFSLPPSATFSGPSNGARQEVRDAKGETSSKPPTRRQLLERALKSCRKLKQKHKRAACEARARARYDPKPKTGKTARGKLDSSNGARR